MTGGQAKERAQEDWMCEACCAWLRVRARLRASSFEPLDRTTVHRQSKRMCHVCATRIRSVVKALAQLRRGNLNRVCSTCW